MPNWKKVIVSGSDASLNSLVVINGVTGSLLGTASWANNATTASRALQANTASYVLSAASSSYALSASNAFTSSYAFSASYAMFAATASSADTFTVRSNAVVTGSFTVVTGSSIEFQVLQTGVKLGNNAAVDTINITGSTSISSSTTALNLRGSGSAVFSIDGTSGRLFSVDDSLTGSLFSVNTAAGLPIIEAFSDNTVRIGQFGQRALFISQSKVGIGKESALNGILDVSGSVTITGSLLVSGSITGSLFGTASWANNAQTSSFVLNAVSSSFATTSSYAFNASNATSASYAQTSSFVTPLRQNVVITGSLALSGSASIGPFSIFPNPNTLGFNEDNTLPGTANQTAYHFASGINSKNTIFSVAKTGINTVYFGNDGFNFYLANERNTTGSFIFKKNLSFGGDLILSGSNIMILDNTTGNLWVSGSVSGSSFTGSLLGTATTASYVLQAVSASFATSAANATSASFATQANTASSADNFNVRNTLTVTTIVAQVITSSTDFVTGSTRFGSSLANTHQFTGSVSITGSLASNISTATISSPFSSGNYPLSLFDGVYNFNFGFYASSVGSNRLSIYRNASQTYFDNSSGNFYFNAPIYSSLFTGSFTGSLFGTASWANNATSASYALTASYATASSVAVSASFATQASNASSASFATSAANATTASYILNAASASFAQTASFVNTLNQNVLITGSLTVGATTAGVPENTLILGARGNVEGGQLLLQSPLSASYTSASMFDVYADTATAGQFLRILRGSNAGSDAIIAQFNLHSKQVQFPSYTGSGAFTGTAAAFLAVDSAGNVITTSGSGASGTAFPFTGSAQITGGLAVTGSITASGPIYSLANNAMYFRGGDDAEFWDINVANTVGIYGQQNQDRAGLKLGSAGPTLFGSGSNLGIGMITPTGSTVTVNGNVWATSFTGSLLGTATTASYVLQSVSASFATSAASATSASFAINAASATSASFATSAANATSASIAANAVTASRALNANTASYANFAITASIADNAVTASRALNANTASYSNFAISSSFASTAASATSASYATFAATASLAQSITPGTTISASNVFVTNNLTVNGTASFSYLQTVSGSAVVIGEEYIVLNTQAPAGRFAGLLIFDSGSNSTASIVWDSQNNHFVYSNASGSTYAGGGFMSGPRNTGSLGNEPYPTLNRVLRGQGGDHLYDSNISDNDTKVSIFINTEVTGGLIVTNGITGSLLGTSSFATSASFAGSAANATSASFATSAASTTSASFATNAASATSASIAANAVTASFILQAVSSSFSTNAANATSASIAANAVTASRALNANTASFTTFAVSSSYADDFTVRNILNVDSASFDYQQNLAIATGSFQTIVSVATGSYRCAFFDYVAFSGSRVRAGTVVSTWSGSVTEFYENYTADLGGSTSAVTLQTAISGSNIQLQAGISGSAWSIRSLVRLL